MKNKQTPPTEASERKRAEEALRENEERLRILVENSPDAIYLLDLNTHQVTFNRQEFCGYTREELESGSSILHAVHPEDLKIVQEHWQKMIHGDIVDCDAIEYRLRQKNGDYVWISSREVALERDERGMPTRLLSTLSDVTARKQAELSLRESEAQLNKEKENLEITIAERTAELKQANDHLQRELDERIRVEEALRRSEKRFRTLFQQAAVGVALIETKTGRYLDVNQKYCDFLGYTKEEMLNCTFQDVTYADDVQENVDNNALLMAGKIREFSIDKRYLRKDGSMVWGNLTASPLWTPGEEAPVYQHIGVIQDINKRKQMEDALHKSKQYFTTLVENAPDLIVRFDSSLRHVYCNPAVERQLGVPADAFIGKTPLEIGQPDQQIELIIKSLKSVLETGEELEVEQIYPTPTGPKHFHTHIVPERDAQGSIESLLAVTRDINDRKRAEDEIIRLNMELEQRILERTAELAKAHRQLKEKFAELEHAQGTLQDLYTSYRIVADNTYDWEFWLDADGRFLYTSPSCKRITGYQREDFMRDPALLQQIIHPDDLPAWQEHRCEAAIKNTAGHIEFRIRHTNGSFVWIGHVCQPVHDEQGRFLGSRGSNRDITQNKQAEMTLRESESALRGIFNAVHESIFLMELDGRVIDANDTTARRLGVQTADLPGTNIYHYLPPHVAERRGAYVEQVGASGQPVRFEDERAGRWIENSVYPIMDEFGRIQRVAVYGHDITERRDAEENLHKSMLHAEALARTASRIFTAQFDMQTLLNAVCEETAQALNACAADIYLYDEQRQELLPAASIGFSPEFRQRIQPLPRAAHDLFSSQLGAANIMQIQDLLNLHPDLLPNARLYAEMDIRTIRSVSIVTEDKLVGILSVYSCEETRQFNPAELTLAKGLADQAALAIVHARLYEQVMDGRKRLRILAQASLEVQEAERRELALELHDELGQVLSSIKLALDMFSMLPEAAALEQLERAKVLAADAVNRVRRMSLELRPGLLDDLGLLPTLQWSFENYQLQTGETVKFDHSGLEQRLPPSVEITIYRIVQEALTNIMRHARKKQVYVNIWVDQQSINVKIIDEGGGFDLASVLAKQESTGLSGMRERANLLGGDVVIESTPGVGTSLTANLPVVFVQENL